MSRRGNFIGSVSSSDVVRRDWNLDRCPRLHEFHDGDFLRVRHGCRRSQERTLPHMALHKNGFRLILAVAAVAVAAALPSSASAGILAADATNCDDQSFSQAFLPFADPASYTLQ